MQKDDHYKGLAARASQAAADIATVEKRLNAAFQKGPRQHCALPWDASMEMYNVFLDSCAGYALNNLTQIEKGLIPMAEESMALFERLEIPLE